MGTVLTGSFPLQQQQQANIMQALIVLSVLGCSFAAPFLQDTPEVVAEKARFNQLWQAQAAAAAAAPDPVQSAAAYVPTHNVHHAQPAHHHVQPAHVPTHTAQHTTSWDSLFPSSTNTHTHHHQQPAVRMNALPAPVAKWTGPVAATVPAGVDGKITQVPETAEVAAARNAFIASYNAALSRAPQPSQTSQHTQSSRHHFKPAPAPRPAPRPAPATTSWSHPAPAQTRWSNPAPAHAPAPAQAHRSFAQAVEVADIGAAHAAFTQAYANAVSANIGQRF